MTKRGRVSPTFKEVQLLSPKQVTLSLYIKDYRRRNNFSQQEMADVCNLYSKGSATFNRSDICRYERYSHAPSEIKFQILLNVMDIDESML